MPKKIIGPFIELQNLPYLDVYASTALDILERMDLVNGALAANGCNCNGHSIGAQRDPYFAGDISELVSRCTPHEVHRVDGDGKSITEIVAIKLDTLAVEVDSYSELCAWIYEES